MINSLQANVPRQRPTQESVLPGWLQGALVGWSGYWTRRRTARHLSRLDDRLLRDVGLTRADVDALMTPERRTW